MHSSVLVTLLAAASGALASPHGAAHSARANHADVALSKRNCAYIPPNPDPEMIDRVYKQTYKLSKDPKVMQVVFITVKQESNFNNLPCGDQESHGLVQQKAPGYGWGSVQDTMNPEHAVTEFIKALMPLYRAHPDWSADVLATRTQQAEAGNWYRQWIGWANGVIPDAKARFLEHDAAAAAAEKAAQEKAAAAEKARKEAAEKARKEAEEKAREEAERKEQERKKKEAAASSSSASVSSSKASVSSSKSQASAEAKSRSSASVTSSIQASITSELVESSSAAAAAAAASGAINVGGVNKTPNAENSFAPEETAVDGSARVAVPIFAVLAAVVVAFL